MSVVLLRNGDGRDVVLLTAINAAGIVPDQDRSAFGDPEVAGWGIQDAPVLLKLHDGRAVYQVYDSNPELVATFNEAAADAVAAYDTAKAQG